MSVTRRWAGWVAAGLIGCVGVSALQGQQAAPRVTDATLLKPADGDWVGYGRDYAETHHSPLRQIDQSNVSKLTEAWSVEVGSEGKLETTPLVFNGVLYGTSTWSQVYAIDLRSKKVKWQFDPALARGGTEAMGPRPCCGPVNRGVALYDGRVYVGLLDGRLVALDAETGAPVWAVQTTPPGTDYTITGAPRIVKGKVVIGQGGAEYGVRGFLAAYDAATGKQAWKFYVIPGDPAKPFEDEALARAAKTWNGQWWKYGGGGTPWDGIAYDPELNLVYVGTGNGSPWNANHRSPGGGDNLYLASIVALNADTGKYVWHYQTTPSDNWDYNAAQPMILADLTIGGQIRKVLMQAPKNGFFYVLDRATGKLISGEPYVFTSWATGIDKETGRPIETEAARYRYTPVRLSPSPVGAHHWPPMAFNPTTGFVYYPGQETSSVFAMEEKFEFKEGQWNIGIRRGSAPFTMNPQAAPPDPKAPPPGGFFVAWDPVAQKPAWKIPFLSSGGALSTAGQLIFVGNSAGRFFALDPLSGKTLWEARLGQGVATPISYELDGKQYIAVMSGISKGKVYGFALP
ncbi:MAG: PQQ-dependent dehydrogenase, methanol/ethanol family [Acidobacteria bacterium]|nr:PQQ-dependent dehydrogenase, methanol/ethanol family [Acidobacteriota bacterium]MSO61491.1 PQQ-dependent dehydrogenase, methanol/ethanol family [Acidobacteriota bacterium]